MLSGIDVHDKQGKIDWHKVAGAGNSFAFVRGAYGDRTDDRAQENFDGARQAGLRCGLYHFYRMNPAHPFTRQIDCMIAVLKHVGYGAGDLPPVLDVEDNPHYDGEWNSSNNTTYMQGLRDWVNRVSAEFHATPIIYTRAGFWNALGKPNAFSDHPLWVAHYTQANSPTIPSGWMKYAFWQFADAETVDGVPGTGDVNRFNGTAADLSALLQG